MRLTIISVIALFLTGCTGTQNQTLKITSTLGAPICKEEQEARFQISRARTLLERLQVGRPLVERKLPAVKLFSQYQDAVEVLDDTPDQLADLEQRAKVARALQQNSALRAASAFQSVAEDAQLCAGMLEVLNAALDWGLERHPAKPYTALEAEVQRVDGLIGQYDGQIMALPPATLLSILQRKDPDFSESVGFVEEARRWMRDTKADLFDPAIRDDDAALVERYFKGWFYRGTTEVELIKMRRMLPYLIGNKRDVLPKEEEQRPGRSMARA